MVVNLWVSRTPVNFTSDSPNFSLLSLSHSLIMATVEAELCFPHLPNISCIKPNKFEIGPVDALLTFLSTLTAVLNLLVIISISHFRQLHSSTNLILLSLAVSDFLKFCWYFDQLLCGLIYLVPTTALVASIGTVVLISADRYIAICDPLHYQMKMTDKVINISICVCWIYGLLYAVTVYIDNVINEEKYRFCLGECMVQASRDFMFVFALPIPVSTIVILYMKVFAMAASQARAIRSKVTTVTSKTSRKSEIKAARNLGIVVIIYLMCYTPFYLAMYSEANIVIFGVSIQRITIYLYFLNSCINPLIYAMLYPWFRKAIRLIITLQILRNGSRDFKIM
uniref:G-protein coupled receptors family 1 profile domain-containing protein n=1 Tax=Neogobius melanostomus TaxID=47308 RepID=A0A8C6UBW2_9GOBI